MKLIKMWVPLYVLYNIGIGVSCFVGKDLAAAITCSPVTVGETPYSIALMFLQMCVEILILILILSLKFLQWFVAKKFLQF